MIHPSQLTVVTWLTKIFNRVTRVETKHVDTYQLSYARRQPALSSQRHILNR